MGSPGETKSISDEIINKLKRDRKIADGNGEIREQMDKIQTGRPGIGITNDWGRRHDHKSELGGREGRGFQGQGPVQFQSGGRLGSTDVQRWMRWEGRSRLIRVV